jgi:hypothetical protein
MVEEVKGLSWTTFIRALILFMKVLPYDLIVYQRLYLPIPLSEELRLQHMDLEGYTYSEYSSAYMGECQNNLQWEYEVERNYFQVGGRCRSQIVL